MSRPAAPHQKGAELQTRTGTKELAGLAVPTFFKQAQYFSKKVEKYFLDFKNVCKFEIALPSTLLSSS